MKNTSPSAFAQAVSFARAYLSLVVNFGASRAGEFLAGDDRDMFRDACAAGALEVIDRSPWHWDSREQYVTFLTNTYFGWALEIKVWTRCGSIRVTPTERTLEKRAKERRLAHEAYLARRRQVADLLARGVPQKYVPGQEGGYFRLPDGHTVSARGTLKVLGVGEEYLPDPSEMPVRTRCAVWSLQEGVLRVEEY